eukprot:10849722-Karenia_brevis.AAC.1
MQTAGGCAFGTLEMKRYVNELAEIAESAVKSRSKKSDIQLLRSYLKAHQSLLELRRALLEFRKSGSMEVK